MEIRMLGTGYAMAQNCYNTCFTLSNGEDYFLVDAGGGNGIFQQVEQANIPYTHIRSMFITHAHTDHLLGAIWMIRKIGTLIYKGKYEAPFHVYCHDLVAQALRLICQMTLPAKFVRELDSHILIHEVKDGDCASISDFSVTFFDIASTKAKQFGFEAKFRDGRRLVCLGDEPYNSVCEIYAKEADWLLCEAFCLFEDRNVFHPYEKHHSTALDAGKIAENLNVKNLLLYHTEDRNLQTRKVRYTAEVKSVYGGAVFVPDDLDVIKI